jgi:hypothetical protein
MTGERPGGNVIREDASLTACVDFRPTCAKNIVVEGGVNRRTTGSQPCETFLLAKVAQGSGLSSRRLRPPSATNIFPTGVSTFTITHKLLTRFGALVTRTKFECFNLECLHAIVFRGWQHGHPTGDRVRLCPRSYRPRETSQDLCKHVSGGVPVSGRQGSHTQRHIV